MRSRDVKPYLATEWDGNQWIIFAKAYPHAMNKARKEGIDHKYLREMDEDDLPTDDSGRVYLSEIAHYSHLSSPTTEVWHVSSNHPLLPTLDGSHKEDGQVEGGELPPPPQFTIGQARVYRVRIEPFINGDGWSAEVMLWQGEDLSGPLNTKPDAILKTLSSEAFFAYLNVKQTLDSMGVRGYIEPEFMPHGPGKGFYGLDSSQERMPLKGTDQGGNSWHVEN